MTMNRACALLGGVGLGAGLMYFLDPDLGRRRRSFARDKAVRLAHEARDAADVVAKDMSNRAQGLASGDLAALAGGKRALSNPLRGGWSPSGRALMGMLGGGLCLYALTRPAPAACLLGTAGLALLAEGLTNAGLDDLRRLPEQAANWAGSAAANLGLGGKDRSAERRENAAQPVGAGI